MMPPPLVAACIGYSCMFAVAGLLFAWALVWGVGLACGFVARVRAWHAVRNRPAWIPAAPPPPRPLPGRLTDARIEAELRRLGEEIHADLGPDFARILGLFADDPHTTDH